MNGINTVSLTGADGITLNGDLTTDNTAAIRLYERMGFKKAKVIYKATEVAGA